jgi:hypothetical protein
VVHVAPQEILGPSEEEDGDFAKELAKMLTDTSAEARKVDKKTALAMWDSAVLPPAARKKQADSADDSAGQPGVMNFTLLTKRGNKNQVRGHAVTRLLLGLTYSCRHDRLRCHRRRHWLYRHAPRRSRTRSNSST